MAIAPLFVKYQTRSGKSYVYDLGSNEIVQIGETMYTILDDFHVLTVDEIVEKHHSRGEHNVREALGQFDRLQSRGILHDHAPALPSRAERVVCQGKEEPFEEFLTNRCQMVIIELTQQCNLRCDYCCYGEHYDTRRAHDSTTMSLETAKSAVRDFFARPQCDGFVVFYGGEPLLEFELLKQIVLFAEQTAAQRGIKAKFHITTNGTLLTDDKIRFLVDHKVLVSISVDGDKESHDRHRVFRSEQHPERRIGSHDLVMRNIKRFVELFPDYGKRHIILTLTATSDSDGINDFLKALQVHFKHISARLVRTPDKKAQANWDGAIRLGCWDISQCAYGCAGQQFSPLENNGDSGRMMGDPGSDDSPQETPDFANWTEERRDRLQSRYDRILRELRRCDDVEAVWREFPLYRGLLAASAGLIHFRDMPGKNTKFTFRYPCFPGSNRLFCTARGVSVVCERTETGRLFQLGDGGSNVDTNRVCRLLELNRCLADCGNCVAKASCPVCFSDLQESREVAGKPDTLAFRGVCQGVSGSFLRRTLERYTEVMEVNPEAFDSLDDGSLADNWSRNVSVLPTEAQLHGAEVGVEELQEVV